MKKESLLLALCPFPVRSRSYAAGWYFCECSTLVNVRHKDRLNKLCPPPLPWRPHLITFDNEGESGALSGHGTSPTRAAPGLRVSYPSSRAHAHSRRATSANQVRKMITYPHCVAKRLTRPRAPWSIPHHRRPSATTNSRPPKSYPLPHSYRTFTTARSFSVNTRFQTSPSVLTKRHCKVRTRTITLKSG